MKVVCCICKDTILDCIPGTEGDPRISHGMHKACAAKFYGITLPLQLQDRKTA